MRCDNLQAANHPGRRLLADGRTGCQPGTRSTTGRPAWSGRSCGCVLAVAGASPARTITGSLQRRLTKLNRSVRLVEPEDTGKIQLTITLPRMQLEQVSGQRAHGDRRLVLHRVIK